MNVDPAGATGNFPSSHAGALPAGSQDQPVTLTPLDGTPSVVGQSYRHTFTWPAGLTCTGTTGGITGVCTAQVFSTSDWVACFAFTQTAPVQSGGGSSGTTGTSGPTGTCQVAAFQSSTPTCAMVTGQTVFVPTGFTVDLLDSQAGATLATNLVNHNVFTNNQALPPVGPYSPCYYSYLRYLCGSTFRLCTNGVRDSGTLGTGTCYDSCREFICWCGLTDIHKLLYPDCNIYTNTRKDAAGNCTVGFGPSGQRCLTTTTGSTGVQCTDLFCGAAPRGAVLQPLLLAAAALATVALLYANL